MPTSVQSLKRTTPPAAALTDERAAIVTDTGDIPATGLMNLHFSKSTHLSMPSEPTAIPKAPVPLPESQNGKRQSINLLRGDAPLNVRLALATVLTTVSTPMVQPRKQL